VSRRRVDYLTDIPVEIGHRPDEAQRRSLVALSTIVGPAGLPRQASPRRTPTR